MQIELQGVHKIYNQGQTNEVQALTAIDMEVAAGSMVCLQGPSGSGKTTLLSIIGCVFQPTSGRAVIGGKQINRLPDRFLTLHRQQTIGFIFQHFNILPELSVQDNITLPLLPLGIPPGERNARAAELMEQLGIQHRRRFPARQVSGGELQRAAIARALINNPAIILADEPTAHLDSRKSLEFLHIMADLKQQGKTILLTSHDPAVTSFDAVDRIITIQDGMVTV